MATLNYDDVVEISEEDAEQSLLNLLDAQGFTATSWQEFSDALAMVHVAAEFRNQASLIAVLLKTILLADQSTGTALTQVSQSFFDNPREAAVETQLAVTLTCDSTHGPYSIDVGAQTLTHLLSGSTYRNIDGLSIVYPVTLSAGSSLTLLFEAEVAGSQANIADAATADQVTLTMDTSLAGVTITAHSLERSGIDEESDDRLRERDQLRWTDVGAIELFDDRVRYYALKADPAVVSVGVDSTNPRGQGTFDVYIAGLDATASDDDVALVQTALDLRTMGRNNSPKTCVVHKAPEVDLDITGVVYFTGANASDVQTAVEAALLDFTRSVPPGGFSYLPGPSKVVPKNDIETVIRNAATSVASSRATVQLNVPEIDIAFPSFGKAVRGAWSLTYVQISV